VHLFWFFINKQVVVLLYSHEYLAVVPLVYFISISNVLHGSGDYVNCFMGAHGKGKELRNTTLIIGIFNIMSYIILIYFGV